jgi:hypothetical protein
MNAQSMNQVEYQDLGFQPTSGVASSIDSPNMSPITPPVIENRTLTMLAAQANLARRARHVAASSLAAGDAIESSRSTIVRRLLRREALPG